MARRTQQGALDRMRSSLQARAAELRPLVEELRQVEAALEVLSRNGAGRRSGQKQGQRSATRSRRRTRRGQRPEQVLAVVKDHPNITVSGMAKELGVKAQGLYPVSRKLVADGKLKKRGTKYTVKR